MYDICIMTRHTLSTSIMTIQPSAEDNHHTKSINVAHIRIRIYEVPILSFSQKINKHGRSTEPLLGVKIQKGILYRNCGKPGMHNYHASDKITRISLDRSRSHDDEK